MGLNVALGRVGLGVVGLGVGLEVGVGVGLGVVACVGALYSWTAFEKRSASSLGARGRGGTSKTDGFFFLLTELSADSGIDSKADRSFFFPYKPAC